MQYKIELIKSELVANGTMAFLWKKPQGFAHKAGQYGDWTLMDPPETDAEGNTRSFSLTSSPLENHLSFATRIRDTAFKRTLSKLKPGTEIQLEGPLGNFVLHNNAAKLAVFIAGGIGVTPFHSMLLFAAHERLPHKIFLFYSNRRPEDAAFLQELIDLQKLNSNYKFIGTMTDMKNSKMEWKGETGYIDESMLKKYITDLSVPIYYLAGPPELVAAMRKILNKSGVDDDDIRTEEFSGY